ncbi:MAG TPA: hypothetical protein DCP36_08645, partial [Sporomusaceae bacterium]|nr:hypothetical protein [Sporomusaceae bacterium]
CTASNSSFAIKPSPAVVISRIPVLILYPPHHFKNKKEDTEAQGRAQGFSAMYQYPNYNIFRYLTTSISVFLYPT